MKIILDVMSGDNAPYEIIEGAFLALNEYPTVEIVMTGDQSVIRNYCFEHGHSLDNPRISIAHTTITISMEDEPLSVVRDKAKSSMGIGLKMLANGEGDAFVSAGNTGALHAGSTLVVRRIKGYSRSAIATLLPLESPLLLIDSGANTEVTKEQLEQFAIMGSIYMNRIFGIDRPRVGLANIGTEPTKGPKRLVEAYNHLSESDKINFIGNIEGKQIPFAECDVLVCDGFTGNTILKLTEGLSKFFMSKVKEVFYKNPLTKASGLVMKPQIKRFKKDFDASEYGGAPMLGISKPVIKAHGSSDATAIKNAIRQSMDFVNTGLIKELARQVQKQDKEEQENE
ncbi:MAG: phosphate acyltransferase PlsX [Clostridia bacterium]|nr:phosphate acyltransferase PlsX [Clostridia bacterium]